jgi:hypothetical protein
MKNLIGYFVLAACACAGRASANDLDWSFGTDGVRRYGFDAVGGGRNDRAAVACPGPRGSLFAVGTASTDRRIVSVWLTENGALDTSFSGDGKESFDLPAAYPHAYGETGLCGSDGKVTVVFESADANGEGRVTLVRVDPMTGLPDPTFGNGGRVEVDLDNYASRLGDIEFPLGVSEGRDRDVIVTGFHDRPNDSTGGFIIRVTATGAVGGVAFAESFDATNKELVAAMPSPDGALWVAGVTSGQPLTGRVFRLDYVTLAWLSTPVPLLPDGFEARRGRASGSTDFMLAGRIVNQPAVAVVTPTGASVLPLPPMPSAAQVISVGIAPLSNGTHVYVADIVEQSNRRLGYYFAGVRRTGAGLALESTFGDDGVRLVPPLPASGCPFARFDLERLTVWRDRPLWFGTGAVCEPDGTSHEDYLFLRLARSDLIFRGGFQ